MSSFSVCAQLFLDYMLFLRRLSTDANVKAQETRDSTLQPQHIRAVAKVIKLSGTPA